MLWFKIFINVQSSITLLFAVRRCIVLKCSVIFNIHLSINEKGQVSIQEYGWHFQTSWWWLPIPASNGRLCVWLWGWWCFHVSLTNTAEPNMEFWNFETTPTIQGLVHICWLRHYLRNIRIHWKIQTDGFYAGKVNFSRLVLMTWVRMLNA